MAASNRYRQTRTIGMDYLSEGRELWPGFAAC
jgi:hypothetical protein